MPFNILNSGSTASLFQVIGAATATQQSLIFGHGPTAGGLVDMTPDYGTFTVPLIGLTTSPTVACAWSRMGRVVIMTINTANGVVQGTSNATSFGVGSIPAFLIPQSLNAQYMSADGSFNAFYDNGVAVQGVTGILLGNAIIQFYKQAGTAWTASGNKGIIGSINFVYQLF
jgi:hypothetical protein